MIWTLHSPHPVDDIIEYKYEYSNTRYKYSYEYHWFWNLAFEYSSQAESKLSHVN